MHAARGATTAAEQSDRLEAEGTGAQSQAFTG